MGKLRKGFAVRWSILVLNSIMHFLRLKEACASALIRILPTLIALCFLSTLNFLTASTAQAAPQDALWIATNSGVSRLDPQTNQLGRILPLTHAATALAIDHQDGALWVLNAATLSKFDVDTKLLFELDLSSDVAGIDQARYLQLNPYDESVWIADSRSVLHVSREGGILTQWQSSSDIQALAIDFDESLWVLTRLTLLHKSATGGLLAVLPLSGLLSEPRYLALDSLGNRLSVANAERVLQFDLKNIYALPRQIDLAQITAAADANTTIPAPTITALGSHPMFGTLWVVRTGNLSIYDRGGNLLKQIDLHTYDLGQINQLVFDSFTANLWLAGDQVLGLFRSNGEFVTRIPLTATLKAVGVSPFKLLPQLWLFDPPAGGNLSSTDPIIRYGLGGDCTGAVCFPDATYTDSLDLDVRVNNQSIGPPFRRTSYEALFMAPKRLSAGVNQLTAQTTDRYGHVSPTLYDQFRVVASVSPVPSQTSTPTNGALPPVTTIPSITTPANAISVVPSETSTTGAPSSPMTLASAPSPTATTVAPKILTSPSVHQTSAPTVNTSLPLSFELNEGQVQGDVQFLARSDGHAVFFHHGETVMVFRNHQPAGKPSGEVGVITRRDGASTPSATQNTRPSVAATPPPAANVASAPASAVLRMKLVGGKAAPLAEGLEPLAMKSHYLIGNDPAKWIKNVPHYAKIKYHDVYPGIDQVFYGKDGALEYDLIVRPGADPAQIQLAFDGAATPQLTAHGDVLLKTPLGSVTHHKPHLYQQVGNQRQNVEGTYRVHHSGRVDLEIKHYDPKLPLVIDPVLSYATYLGGSASDAANAVTLDGQGNTYVTGSTLSTDFPLPAGVPTYNLPATVSGGAFVTKLNAAGAAVYTTYFGGTTGADTGNALAVDAAGNVYIAGNALSTDFPVTAGVVQSQKKGASTNAFVAKLAPDGSALTYATYLGGSANYGDEGHGIAIDANGNAYVVGTANSSDFPTTPGAFQPQKITTVSNAFVAKLNATGTQLIYSTYLGSSTYPGTSTGGGDTSAGIVVDSNGNAYVVGVARSPDFPTTAGAYQITPGANPYDAPVYAFVTKLNPTGAALTYSTLLGGASEGTNASHAGISRGAAIALDGQNNVIVVGDTNAVDFPVTANAYQKTLATQNVTRCTGTDCYTPANAFITKLNLTVPGTGALLYSTYLGGTGCLDPGVSQCLASIGDSATAATVDSAGNAYVAGVTTASELTFPVRYGLGLPYNLKAGFASPFLAKFDWTAFPPYVTPLVTVFYPPTSIHGVAVTADGSQTTIVGESANASLTTTPNAVQPQSPANKQQNAANAYLARIDNSAPFALSISTSSNPAYVADRVTEIVSWAGGNQPTGAIQICEQAVPNPPVCFNAFTLNPSSQSNIISRSLGVGTYTLWATYAGDTNNAPVTSANYLLTVKPSTAVVITAPLDGTTMTSGTPFPVTVQATSKDTEGNVVRLDLYQSSAPDDILLQTVNAGSGTFPAGHAVTFSFSMPGVAAGYYAYNVRATTDSVPAVVAISAFINMQMKDVQTPPVIAITDPVSGASFTVPTAVVLTINASSNSGRIQILDIYDTSTLVQEINVPYGQSLANFPLSLPLVVGAHSYSVKATDDLGMSTTSNTVDVTVIPTPAGLPVVTITAPVNGASFTVPASFAVTASASSSISTLKTLEFFDGTTLIYTYTVPLYASTTVRNAYQTILAPGVHSYTVKATDNAGQSTTSSAVNVTVTGPVTAPTASLTAPASSAFYIAPALISLQATAASTNTNATITKVEFFQGATSLGVSTSAPYSLTWNNVVAGTYSLTAKATDSLGATATTTPVTVTVGANPVVTAPSSGVTLDGNTATVTGTVQAPANSSVTVNGLVGTIAPNGSFFVGNVPLTVGVNNLTVTITSPDGHSSTQTLNVTSSGPASFVFRASPTQGLTPLQVTLTLSQASPPPFDHVDVYCQTTGSTPSLTVPAANLTTSTALGSCLYNTPGVYTAKVNVVNAATQIIYTSTQLIQVDALNSLDATLQNIYIGMLNQLKAGNIPGALNAVTAGVYDKYNTVFTSIGTANLATVVDQLGTIQDGQIGDGYAEYVVVRNTPTGPQAFLIYLIRGEDGIWRIDGM